jgi:hypothetical protein
VVADSPTGTQHDDTTLAVGLSGEHVQRTGSD